MNHRPVHSSHITSVGYEDGRLEVKFVNGATYRYAGVPVHLYAQFMAAPRPGQWFRDNIHGQFPHAQVIAPRPAVRR